MYCEYYNLFRPPFEMTPDPSFLYLGELHREGLAALVYGIRSGKGFLLLLSMRSLEPLPPMTGGQCFNR